MPRHRKGVPTPELADEYLAGATTVELAAKYDMTPSGVNARLTHFGVAMRNAKRRTRYDEDPAFVEEVRSAYLSGRSSTDIAKDHGVGRSSVMRTLDKAGITKRRNGTRSKTIVLPTDPLKIGYLAGLFDGEGNLQFKDRENGSTACKVAIYSTTTSVMGWLKATVGGHVRWDYRRQETKGWLPIGSWDLYRAQDVLAFLLVVQPLLLVKAKATQRAIKHLSQQCHATIHPR